VHGSDECFDHLILVKEVYFGFGRVNVNVDLCRVDLEAALSAIRTMRPMKISTYLR
jgi:hypothetical protein